jgi:LAO/AO transport system kinase
VVLVLVPGYGDTLQAMKAGILEIADVVAVNKGDTPGADQTRKELAQQRYERQDPTGGEPWQVPVVLTSALRREGVDRLLAEIDRHHQFTGSSAWRQLTEQRRQQSRFVGFVESLVRQQLLGAAQEAAEQERLTDPFGAAQEYVTRLLDAHTQITAGPHRVAAGTESR